MNWRKLPLLAAARLARLFPGNGGLIFYRLVEPSQPLTVRRFRGRTHAATEGMVVTVGTSPYVDWLPQCFFAGETECEYLPSQTLFGLRRRLLAESRPADLVVARVDRVVARWLQRRDFIRTPMFIGATMPVPASVAELSDRHPSIAADLRKMRQRHLTPEVTREEASLRRFYEELYLPHLQRRFGPLALTKSLSEFVDAARHGGLIQIRRDGEIVGGLLFRRQRNRAIFVALATRPTKGLSAEPGVGAACYYHFIETARRDDAREIDWGGSRPALEDGVLRYKQKWGARLADNPHSHHDLLVRWETVTPAVAAFFAQTSLLTRAGTGFTALTASSVPDRTYLAVPGLTAVRRLIPGAPFAAVSPRSVAPSGLERL